MYYSQHHKHTCRIIGSSILPFAIDPKFNSLYFLLARERSVPGWEGSDTWSDFGGGKKFCDVDDADVAAREFQEESLAVVRYRPDEPALPRADYDGIAQGLRGGHYTFKCHAYTPNRKARYTTFVKQIPFDAAVGRAHATAAALLRSIRSNGGRSTTYAHPAIDGDGRVNEDFLEKTALRWWSVPQLLSRHKRVHDALRPSFERRLQVILREFPSEGIFSGGAAPPCNAATISPNTYNDIPRPIPLTDEPTPKSTAT